MGAIFSYFASFFLSKPTPSALEAPLKFHFSGKVASNRLFKAAMTEHLCAYNPETLVDHGRPSVELIRLYEEWSKGGYGVIVTGNILVDVNHLEAKGNAIIDRSLPDYTADYAKLARAARKHTKPLLLAQLNHPGSQSGNHLQPNPVAPSDVQCPPAIGEVFNKPTPLTEDGIWNIIDRFAYAASVLHKAGFDGVQLHGAHGYLITQFLSPATNLRKDQWGGSLENRSRFVFEIIKAIRKKTPANFSISIKLNSQDYIDGGFTTADCHELARRLEAAGIDFIELSGGVYQSCDSAFEYKAESTKRREAFFIEFAEKVTKHLTKSKVALTGGFRTLHAMKDAVETHSTDLVGLARPLCAEPHIGTGLLSGKTTACHPTLLPPSMGLQIGAAVAQIRDIGEGRKPTDFNVEENVKAFLAAIFGSAH